MFHASTPAAVTAGQMWLDNGDTVLATDTKQKTLDAWRTRFDAGARSRRSPPICRPRTTPSRWQQRQASGTAASKAGIVGFTRSLAREIGGYGITVNVVTPWAHRHRGRARIGVARVARG